MKKKLNPIAKFYLWSGAALTSIVLLIGVKSPNHGVLIPFLVGAYLLPVILAERGWIIKFIWALNEDAAREDSYSSRDHLESVVEPADI
jgi:hypothetical protein